MTPREIIAAIGIAAYIGVWMLVIWEMKNAPEENENNEKE